MSQSLIARQLAEKAHEGRFRRDGVTPEFSHCVRVREIAKRRGGDDLVEAACYLHDSVESGVLSYEDMRSAGICEEVVVAVKLLTFNNKRPYQEQVRSLLGNRIARETKIADNLANIGDEPTDRQVLKYTKSLQLLLEPQPPQKFER